MTLVDLVDSMVGMRILVVGDPMHDVYHWGRVERVSPEAPVPVLVEESIETRPGGSCNVAQNLSALGCAIETCFPPEPWTVKSRFMAGKHQLLRVDKDYEWVAEQEDIPETDGYDAIVLSDYAKGWLTPEMCRAVIWSAMSHNIPVIVDPKLADWSKFSGCSVICPNQQELLDYEFAAGQSVSSYQATLGVVVKQGADGILVVVGNDFRTFSATARHVYDVTGAGDTVVAVVAATLAARGDIYSAARLAVLAAGHVVGEVGTTAIDRSTLRALAESQP